MITQKFLYVRFQLMVVPWQQVSRVKVAQFFFMCALKFETLCCYRKGLTTLAPGEPYGGISILFVLIERRDQTFFCEFSSFSCTVNTHIWSALALWLILLNPHDPRYHRALVVAGAEGAATLVNWAMGARSRQFSAILVLISTTFLNVCWLYHNS